MGWVGFKISKKKKKNVDKKAKKITLNFTFKKSDHVSIKQNSTYYF